VLKKVGILNGSVKRITNNNNMGSKPITNKASSACKINMGLVMGQADVQNSKSFVDYGKLMEDKMKSGGGKTASKEAILKSDSTETDTTETEDNINKKL
jgi:hypothetical protein